MGYYFNNDSVFIMTYSVFCRTMAMTTFMFTSRRREFALTITTRSGAAWDLVTYVVFVRRLSVFHTSATDRHIVCLFSSHDDGQTYNDNGAASPSHS
jgi:hypothetical protein